MTAVRFISLFAFATIAPTSACRDAGVPATERTDDDSIAARAVNDAITRADLLADSVAALLVPVPLLTPAQENALRRFGNAQQLARARRLGVRPTGRAHIDRLVDAGELVRLADSTAHWRVRKLDHSLPYVTPDVHVLLERIATAFQSELQSRGLPRYRIEITSALRTAESQSDLRQTNVNAAGGISTHEFATTVDIGYDGFAAPADILMSDHESPALAAQVSRITAAFLEAAAARKSRELQAILGGVLLGLQNEGVVMVTLERQQPVYHLTVARPLR